MTVNQQHVVILGLGPVQGLVGAARKARDAWAASDLVSTWTRDTADACRAAGLDVVVPTKDATTVANKIVIETADPRAAGDRAASLARSKFEAIAEKVRKNLRGAEDRALWDGQSKALPEVWWAAAPIGDPGWGRARSDAEAALGERKHTRDFLPWTGCDGVHKSSVDGRWEGVFTDAGSKRLRERGPGRIGNEEVLDLAGALRRFWKNDTFPSVLDIAVHEWLAAHPRRKQIDALAASSDIEVGDLVLGAPAGWKKEYGDQPAWERVARERDALVGRSAPPPYYAVIVADGDKVGRRLSSLGTRAAHEEAAARLGALAAEVRRLQATVPGAHVLYAGGDDALVFAPLSQALSVAQEIRAAGSRTAVAGAPVTFTVAVAIGHVHDSLRGTIARARDAERDVKAEGGGRLVITVDPRGGSETRVMVPWEQDPVGWFAHACAWLAAGEVPAGLGYELRRLVTDLDRVPAPMIKREVERVLGRKRRRDGEKVAEAHLETLLKLVPGTASTLSSDALDGLTDLERRLRVAAFLNRYAARDSEARP